MRHDSSDTVTSGGPTAPLGARTAATDTEAFPSSFSFPSGHAATGVAVFGLLELLAASVAATRAGRVAAVVAGLVLGALIAASRVVLDVHNVTDVLAGARLWLAFLVGCLLVLDRLGR
jgi:membrane-associated phospholipid phosphatase